jgi:hypothetical protein
MRSAFIAMLFSSNVGMNSVPSRYWDDYLFVLGAYRADDGVLIVEVDVEKTEVISFDELLDDC